MFTHYIYIFIHQYSFMAAEIRKTATTTTERKKERNRIIQ